MQREVRIKIDARPEGPEIEYTIEIEGVDGRSQRELDKLLSQWVEEWLAEDMERDLEG